MIHLRLWTLDWSHLLDVSLTTALGRLFALV